MCTGAGAGNLDHRKSSNAGNTRTYNSGTTQPATWSVNFVARQAVANAVAIPICRFCTINTKPDSVATNRDIGVYLDSANAYGTIDVFGYFVLLSRAPSIARPSLRAPALS